MRASRASVSRPRHGGPGPPSPGLAAPVRARLVGRDGWRAAGARAGPQLRDGKSRGQAATVDEPEAHPSQAPARSGAGGPARVRASTEPDPGGLAGPAAPPSGARPRAVALRRPGRARTPPRRPRARRRTSSPPCGAGSAPACRCRAPRARPSPRSPRPGGLVRPSTPNPTRNIRRLNRTASPSAARSPRTRRCGRRGRGRGVTGASRPGPAGTARRGRRPRRGHGPGRAHGSAGAGPASPVASAIASPHHLLHRVRPEHRADRRAQDDEVALGASSSPSGRRRARPR